MAWKIVDEPRLTYHHRNRTVRLLMPGSNGLGSVPAGTIGRIVFANYRYATIAVMPCTNCRLSLTLMKMVYRRDFEFVEDTAKTA